MLQSPWGWGVSASSDPTSFPIELPPVSSEQALKELGLAEHQLRFTCRGTPARHAQGAGDGHACVQPPEEVGAQSPFPWVQGARKRQLGLTGTPCSVLKDH